MPFRHHNSEQFVGCVRHFHVSRLLKNVLKEKRWDQCIHVGGDYSKAGYTLSDFAVC